MSRPPEMPADGEETFSSPVILVLEQGHGVSVEEAQGEGRQKALLRGVAALFLPEVRD